MQTSELASADEQIKKVYSKLPAFTERAAYSKHVGYPRFAELFGDVAGEFSLRHTVCGFNVPEGVELRLLFRHFLRRYDPDDFTIIMY